MYNNMYWPCGVMQNNFNPWKKPDLVWIFTSCFISYLGVELLGCVDKLRFHLIKKKTCQTYFCSRSILWNSHQHYLKVPISPPYHQYLLVSVFLTVAILVGVKWCRLFYFAFPGQPVMLSIFACAYWPWVHFLCWNVYSHLSVGHRFMLSLFLLFFVFLGPPPKHMEVPRLGVNLEL